jgi:hypothetical protein
MLCHHAIMTSERTPAAGLQKLLDETERLVGARVPQEVSKKAGPMTQPAQEQGAIRIREAVEAAD